MSEAPGGVRGSRHGALCGEDGVVAGVFHRNGTYGEEPDAPRIYQSPPSSGPLPGTSLTVRVRGRYLWIRRVTCGACAAIVGWGFAGDLAALSDSQLLFVQAAAGFPEGPPLRTAADWEGATAALDSSP